MVQFLHLRIGPVEILHNNGIQQAYFSITHQTQQYFTSVFTRDNLAISDDIFIQLEQARFPENMTLKRWEGCMTVFTFELDASELRSRGQVKKRMQTRQQEIINIQMHLYDQRDIFFTDKYIDSISQHYLVIEELYNCKEIASTRAYNSLNYFTVTTKHSSYILPQRTSVIVIKLPDYIQISSFVNNHFNGKSERIDHSKIQSNQEIDIKKEGKSTTRVKLKAKWGVNLHQFKMDQNVLSEVNQLLLYDFQIKFDNTTDVAGCKLKIQHNNKAFDFAEDIDHSKVTKIKKIIYFIIKSENQEIDLVVHKNNKPFTICRITSAEIQQNALNILKKKWADPNNPSKFYGYIKMRAERGRNVSIPQSNKYWRQALKRKQTATNMMIALHQVSAHYSQNQQLAIVAKMENEEKIIKPLNNLNYYNDDDQPSKEVFEFAVKGEESLYLVVKNNLNSNDFCGIGVVNTTDLRLGMNACEVGFFKNQQKAGTINCIINKIVFWPFIKPLFQPQIQQQPLPPLQIDLFLNKILFTSYFYTFKYDNKKEVYCIVEVNKIKKVLILQNVEHDQLNFTAAAGSDLLNYTVEQPDNVRIKLTFLVSDLGHEQEIYGIATCKIRASDLEKEVKLKNVEIKNDYSVNLGAVSFEVFRGVSSKNLQKSPQAEKKSIGSSFDLSQASFDTNILSNNKNSPSRRYSGSYINNSKPIIHDFLKKNTHPSKSKEVKLPIIKEKKDKNNFQDLVQLMKVRKRGQGGFYEENRKDDKELRKQRQSFDLKRIEQSNPNLDRNLEILFPKKANDKQIQMGRSRQIDYEERLKGLRSVMNQMEDIGEVEPSVLSRHQMHQNRQRMNQFTERQQPNEIKKETQYQGNQFL